MEFFDREKLLRRITSKRLYTSVFFDNQRFDVLFIDPSLDITTEADWVYSKLYQENKNSTDFLTQEEAIKILIDDGKWSAKKDKDLEKLYNDVKFFTEYLPTIRFKKAEQRNVLKNMDKCKKKIVELEKTKSQYSHMTLENFCYRERQKFIVSKIHKVLNIEIDFSQNIRFLDILAVYYFEENAISMLQLRELARTDPWRLYWTASKESNIPLFPHSSVEMSEWQYLLVLWTKIYDFAYASNNRPSDEIISDDSLFDNWYNAETNRIKKEIASNKPPVNSSGPSSGNGLQETFIPADLEGAKEVLELNNADAARHIKTLHQKIQEQEEVPDANLPLSQQLLRMEANKAAMQRR